MNEHENGLPLGGDETPEVPALPEEPAVTEEIVPAEPAEVLPEEPAEELPAEPVEEVPAESVEELPEESAEPMAEETAEEVTGISFEVFDEQAQRTMTGMHKIAVIIFRSDFFILCP